MPAMTLYKAQNNCTNTSSWNDSSGTLKTESIIRKFQGVVCLNFSWSSSQVCQRSGRVDRSEYRGCPIWSRVDWVQPCFGFLLDRFRQFGLPRHYFSVFRLSVIIWSVNFDYWIVRPGVLNWHRRRRSAGHQSWLRPVVAAPLLDIRVVGVGMIKPVVYRTWSNLEQNIC